MADGSTNPDVIKGGKPFCFFLIPHTSRDALKPTHAPGLYGDKWQHVNMCVCLCEGVGAWSSLGSESWDQIKLTSHVTAPPEQRDGIIKREKACENCESFIKRCEDGGKKKTCTRNAFDLESVWAEPSFSYVVWFIRLCCFLIALCGRGCSN